MERSTTVVVVASIIAFVIIICAIANNLQAM